MYAMGANEKEISMKRRFLERFHLILWRPLSADLHIFGFHMHHFQRSPCQRVSSLHDEIQKSNTVNALDIQYFRISVALQCEAILLLLFLIGVYYYGYACVCVHIKL